MIGSFRSRGLLCLVYGLVLAAGGFVASGRAQDDAETTGRARTRLLADRTIYRQIDGQEVICYYGNVLADRDSMDARADSAKYYLASETYELFSNVRLRQHESILLCDHAIYRDAEAAGDYFGNVRVEEGEVIGTADEAQSRRQGSLLRMIGAARLVSPEYTVWGDTITRDRDRGEGEAFGAVQVLDPESQTLVTGRHAVFSENGEVARVDRDPVLVTREQQDKPLESLAGVMTFYRASEMAVMIDSVVIRQGRMIAWADTAVIHGQERVVLTGVPRVSIDESNAMFGHEIEFLYRDGALHRIFLRGDARMEDSTPDSLAAIYIGVPDLNVLEGDTITIEMAKDEIQRSVVVGNAHSLYVPDEVIDEVAFNDVTGDTIVITFGGGRISRVDVAGNMNGEYTFARIDQLAGAGGAPADSAAAASGPRDFAAGAENAKYSGHGVAFRLDDRRIDIEQQAQLDYGTMTLTADEVTFDTVRRELYADGNPLLVDKGEDVAGDQMGYNFDSRAGAVRHGVTKSAGAIAGGESYYSGDEIRRFDDGTLKIVSGSMTACDLAEPHYHFWSQRMRIRMKDKVAAAPIVLKIGKVPVFALPFFFKSLKNERRSGVIFPSFNFGWSSRSGRYVRDFGYYWATNDYLDFGVEFDYDERDKFSYELRNRYKKRYSFDGSIKYNNLNVFEGSNQRKEWTLAWRHQQDALFDEYRFRADVKMSSTALTRDDLSADAGRDIVRGQNTSNVYVSRSWSLVSANASASRKEYVNATDDDPATDGTVYTQTLPNLSLSLKRTALAPPKAAGADGSFLGDVLRNTYLNQSYSLGSSRTSREVSTTDVYRGSANMSLSINPPRVSIFTVSAGASGARSWTRTEDTGQSWLVDPDDDTIGTWADIDSTDVQVTQSLSFTTSVGTKLYGLFPVKLGRLRALRHTFSLQVGQSFRPSLGVKQSRSESYSLSLSNRFDAKYLSRADQDTTWEEKKLDGVLDWGLSTGFNPDGPSGARWSSIGSSLNIRPGQNRNLNLRITNSIDPYAWALTRTSFSYGISFDGRFDTGGDIEVAEAERNTALDRLGAPDSTAVAGSEDEPGDIWEGMDHGDGYGEDEFDMSRRPESGRGGGHGDGKDDTEGGRYLPWSFGTNFSYSKAKSYDATARGSVNLSTSITRNWKFMYNASFDLTGGTMTRQSYSLTRDLHCWRMEFSRIVSDVDQQFGFRIYLLSVPEVKLTRGREGLVGNLGGGSFY